MHLLQLFHTPTEPAAAQHARHIRGWLCYSWAYEVFVIVSLTLFLPVCLEQFARDNGVWLPDKTEPCVPKGTNSTIIPDPTGNGTEVDGRRCVIGMGWLWVDSASFSLYVFSASVFLQALTVISISVLADHRLVRRKLLAGFAVVGAAATIAFIPLDSKAPYWPVVALLAIIANVCFGASVVVNNAYLPELASGIEQVKEKQRGWKATMKRVKSWVHGQSEQGSNGQGGSGTNGTPAAGGAAPHHHLFGHHDPIPAPTNGSNTQTPTAGGAAHPEEHHHHLFGHHDPQTAPEAPEAFDETAHLLPRLPVPPEEGRGDVVAARIAYNRELEQYTARLSSLGVALGYTAGILVLLLTFIPVLILKGSTLSLRIAIGASGVWWFLWTIPAVMMLPSPSYYFGAGDNRSVSGTSTTSDTMSDSSSGIAARRRRILEQEQFVVSTDLKRSWLRLFKMLHIHQIAKLSQTFLFLLAWFLLSDGFTTITSTAILFAKTTLHMKAPQLLLVGLLAPSCGILGAIIVPLVQHRLKLSNLIVIIILVILISLVPLYGCLGFLPHFQKGNAKFGGLTKPGEIYGLAVYFGFFYGAFQGFARAFFSEIIPRGEEARWFALYSITDKSSSFIGPLVVGIIADKYGNIRYAFFFLVVLVWTAVPLLAFVRTEKARDDAKKYAEDRDRAAGLII